MIARTPPSRRARRPHGELRERLGNYLSVRPLQVGNYVSADISARVLASATTISARRVRSVRPGEAPRFWCTTSPVTSRSGASAVGATGRLPCGHPGVRGAATRPSYLPAAQMHLRGPSPLPHLRSEHRWRHAAHRTLSCLSLKAFRRCGQDVPWSHEIHPVGFSTWWVTSAGTAIRQTDVGCRRSDAGGERRVRVDISPTR